MNIYQKMLEVMKGVSYLSKDDKVEFKNTKYKAISEEKDGMVKNSTFSLQLGFIIRQQMAKL